MGLAACQPIPSLWSAKTPTRLRPFEGLIKEWGLLALQSTKVFGLDVRLPEHRLFLVLLLLCFTVAVTTGTWDLGNSRVVFWHEWIFIAGYTLIIRQYKPLLSVFRQRPISVVLVVAWLVSISLSLLMSPYELRHITIAQHRFFETVSHVVFFVVLGVFLSSYTLPLRKIWIVILISYAVVVVHAFLTWHFSPEPMIHEHRMWFSNFPFTGHARHAGYNMMVATLVGIFLLAHRWQSLSQQILAAVGLFLVLTCLVWLGGRGSMLSVILGLVLVLWWGRKGYRLSRSSLGKLAFLALVSVFVADQLSVFGFNGLGNSISRSVEAESANRLSSGRLTIWAYSLEAVKDHWLLGLGSQAYMFMPERTFHRTAMPHNMIVQFLVEWGVLGTALFLMMLAQLFAAGVAKLRRSGGDAAIITAATICTALTLHGLTDGTYYHGKPGFYLALGFAIWLAGRSAADKNCQSMPIKDAQA